MWRQNRLSHFHETQVPSMKGKRQNQVKSRVASVAASRWTTTKGLPFPLGPTRLAEEGACALYSRQAQCATVLLYTINDVINPVFEYRFVYLKNKIGRFWHCCIPFGKIQGATYYAYRVDGPAPSGRPGWHPFDRDRILLELYAKFVFFPTAFERLAGTRLGSNAGKAPPGVLAGDSEHFDWQGHRGPRHEGDTVIYEPHIGGLTRNPNSGIRDEVRSSIAGLVEEIPYSKDLGITVVELMPVFQYDPIEDHYRRYMPLYFFTPHHGYFSNHTVQEQHNEVPVGFKWFVDGPLDASQGFGSEEHAGASFNCLNGSIRTAERDDTIPAPLSAEITAKMGRDSGELYSELAHELGEPVYDRVETPAKVEQKHRLAQLSPLQITSAEMAGEKIRKNLAHAPGKRRSHRWHESSDGERLLCSASVRHRGHLHNPCGEFHNVDHLRRILEEAQVLVEDTLAVWRRFSMFITKPTLKE